MRRFVVGKAHKKALWGNHKAFFVGLYFSKLHGHQGHYFPEIT